jgi:hypothetical protein
MKIVRLLPVRIAAGIAPTMETSGAARKPMHGSYA